MKLTCVCSTEALEMKLILEEPPRLFHIRLLPPDIVCNLILETTCNLFVLGFPLTIFNF